MTDLEITRLCAEAMGLPQPIHPDGSYPGSPRAWNPLHDDAQAMALVKKFRITQSWNVDEWLVLFEDEPDHWMKARNKDLNRAICECVAKMQSAKTKPLSAFERHGCPMHEADMTAEQAYNATCP